MKQRGTRLYRSLSLAFLGLVLVGLWILLPDFWPFRSRQHQKLLFTETELLGSLASFSPLEAPRFDAKSLQGAALGRALFVDTRFSDQGQMSCATCHQPGRAFTDGRPLAVGTEALTRHTPSLLNSFAGTWFFWDGRADSLSAQVQGPVEAAHEHGVDRGRVAQILWQNYRELYASIFGPWPSSLGSWLESTQPFRARPRREPIEFSLGLAHYAIATISSSPLQTRWIQAAASAKLSPQRYLASHYIQAEDPQTEAVLNYAQLNAAQQAALDHVFANFSWALAQFERGLVANRSPFDGFAARSLAAQSLQLDERFAEKEWRGYRVFMESGCANCHNGPLLSDQQFHNIGLGQGSGPLDLGRAAGLLQVKADRFNCLYKGYPSAALPSESCAELGFLKLDGQEAVGAFKTPSLRNIAETAPYMHDGRFASLQQVLAHYNELEAEPAVGHRTETLQPLRLKAEELEALESFLRSLSAPVDDLTLQTH